MSVILKLNTIDTDKKIIADFLLKYQEELIQKAKTIGLMSHASTNGMLKEYLVKSVLKSILPSSCEICSGIIFDGKGGKSRQIDIIILDKRSPKFEFAKGIGYYPIEGVLACIEIKSKLNKDDIHAALQNSLSVLTLSPILCGEVQIADGDNWVKPRNDEERRKATYQFFTATYIFSFDSIKMETACKHISEFIDTNRTELTEGHLARLPRCIVGKEWVSMLDDSYVEIPKKELEKAETGNALFCFNTENAFLYFISHLLHKISIRIKMSQGVTNCYFSINELLPIGDLLSVDSIKNPGQTKYITL